MTFKSSQPRPAKLRSLVLNSKISMLPKTTHLRRKEGLANFFLLEASVFPAK